MKPKSPETSSPTEQSRWERVDSDGGEPNPGRWNPASSGMRRSCDPCGRRKKKCDREQPCRRCQETGDACTYSKRRWHLPHLQPPRKKQQHLRQQPRGLARLHAAQVLQYRTSSATPEQNGMLSLKRCRISASPATGLVGMQENGFLSDFFGCIGFLPLTTPSQIRETMVKIMLHPASQERPTLGGGCGEDGQYDGGTTGGGFDNTFGVQELPMGPSTCIFWCAVALGALVKGIPTESVATYSQRATDAILQSDSGPAHAEVAQAWTNLAYLYGFMGDVAKFQEYLKRSETVLAATIEQGSTDKLPVGFAEIIQDREKPTTSSNMESICSREQVYPQLDGISTEHELYRYVRQAFRFFEQATFSKLLDQSSLSNEASGEWNGDESHRNDVPQAQDMSEAMVSVMVSVWFDEQVLRFSPLQEAVDRPSIRAGVGGMLINGCLGFEAAGDGDVRNTLKRFSRCVEVFTRYPGLCRFHWMGSHKAHTMLAGLAALDTPGARAQYERLRTAYNSSRPRGSPPVPPMDEWQGISSICDDLYCRAMEGLIASDRMSVFSTKRDEAFSRETGGCKGEEVCGLSGQSQSGHSAASIVPKKEAFTSAPCSPSSSETGPELYGTMDASGLSRVGDGRTEQSESTGEEKTPNVSATFPSRYYLATTEPNGEDDASSDIDVVNGGKDCGFSLSGMGVETHEAMLMMPEELSDGAIGEMEDQEIAPADWLDVTYAMLDAVNESGQACL